MKYDKEDRYPRSVHLSIREEDKLTIPVKNKINKDIIRISNIINDGNYRKIKYNLNDLNETVRKYYEYKIKNI